MKKTIAILLTAVMLVSMLATLGISVSAATGNTLYEVNFSGDDGIYKPYNFRNGADKMAATVVEVQDGGKTIVATAPASAGAAYFYGGAINGLELGVDKQYTMTMKVAFPTGNAGVYFNFGDPDTSVEPTKDITYNWIYGVYGQIKSGNCFTLSIAAGGKITGEHVSNSGAYTPIPEGVENDGSGFVDVRFEIDGLYYSVFLNDKYYDSIWMNEDVLEEAPHLGFTLYLYNNNASVTVKDVVVKEGVEYTKANSTRNITYLDYDSFAEGAKITDILFNANTGAYQAFAVQEANAAGVEYTISEDGKKITIDNNGIGNGSGSGCAHWYGDVFHGLHVGEGYKYTFVYWVKETGSKTAGCVAFNAMDSAFATGNRINWYGSYTYNGTPYLKFAYNGTNFPDYNYPGSATGGENMKDFSNIIPDIDDEGYAQVIVELDGWKWTIYLVDIGTGVQVAAQTVDVKEVADAKGLVLENSDDLAFITYTYNVNLTMSIKNAELYKGLVAADHAVLPPEETTAEATTAEATTAEQTTAAPDVDTTAPEAQTTEAPTAGGDETTKAPDTTTAAPKEDDKGCGSVVACGIALVAVLGTAYVAKRKF